MSGFKCFERKYSNANFATVSVTICSAPFGTMINVVRICLYGYNEFRIDGHNIVNVGSVVGAVLEVFGRLHCFTLLK